MNEHNIPQIMYLNKTFIDNEYDIANLFAFFFKSVYGLPKPPNLSDNNHPSDLINLNYIHITLADVFDGLYLLKPKYSSGPDRIPPIILHNCYYSLSVPLFLLFKLSLNSSTFPLKRESSFIQPIIKSGDKSNIINYRPISLFSSIPKLFEKLIAPKINFIFKNAFINKQHGFKSGRSIN
jgi:sarcosine oxidase/L-pipecolate oxidase